MNYLVTGLICSGKSTFLDIAKEYSFDAIKSDDIVSSLYNDESVVHEIKKHLNIKSNQDNLQAIVKKLFFTSKKNREIIKSLYDERFCRMWEFYLAASEVAFRYLGMTVYQIQLTKKSGIIPITRDYIEVSKNKIVANKK